MVDTSKSEAKRARDIYYFRQRLKNRVFAKLVSFFADEADRSGITKRDIAIKLDRDPSQITRWLSGPGNLTLDTISDLLLAMDAELDPGNIVRFADRPKRNYAHPMIELVAGASISTGSANIQASVSTPTTKLNERVNASAGHGGVQTILSTNAPRTSQLLGTSGGTNG